MCKRACGARDKGGSVPRVLDEISWWRSVWHGTFVQLVGRGRLCSDKAAVREMLSAEWMKRWGRMRRLERPDHLFRSADALCTSTRRLTIAHIGCPVAASTLWIAAPERASFGHELIGAKIAMKRRRARVSNPVGVGSRFASQSESWNSEGSQSCIRRRSGKKG